MLSRTWPEACQLSLSLDVPIKSRDVFTSKLSRRHTKVVQGWSSGVSESQRMNEWSIAVLGFYCTPDSRPLWLPALLQGWAQEAAGPGSGLLEPFPKALQAHIPEGPRAARALPGLKEGSVQLPPTPVNPSLNICFEFHPNHSPGLTLAPHSCSFAFRQKPEIAIGRGREAPTKA
jgi:hypothetical protein